MAPRLAVGSEEWVVCIQHHYSNDETILELCDLYLKLLEERKLYGNQKQTAGKTTGTAGVSTAGTNCAFIGAFDD